MIRFSLRNPRSWCWAFGFYRPVKWPPADMRRSWCAVCRLKLEDFGAVALLWECVYLQAVQPRERSPCAWGSQSVEHDQKVSYYNGLLGSCLQRALVQLLCYGSMLTRKHSSHVNVHLVLEVLKPWSVPLCHGFLGTCPQVFRGLWCWCFVMGVCLLARSPATWTFSLCLKFSKRGARAESFILSGLLDTCPEVLSNNF